MFFLKNQSKDVINYGNGDKEELSNRSNNSMINPAFVIGGGYNFNTSKKLKLSVEPALKFYFKEYLIEHSGLYCFGLKD